MTTLVFLLLGVHVLLSLFTVFIELPDTIHGPGVLHQPKVRISTSRSVHSLSSELIISNSCELNQAMYYTMLLNYR